MALRGTIFVIALLAVTVEGIPTVAFPINSQVPPIARVEEPFSYTFSPSTFDSPLPMSYRLSSGPDWLSLDSGTRHLSGTPSSSDANGEDVTGVNIELTASDQSGSTSVNATLVISQAPPPSIQIPLSDQLPTFGSYSAPYTLLLHPSTPFKFAFNSGTFGDDARNLSYYAVSSDNTPLPSWIRFDSTSFSFEGRTPDYASLIQPPQTFGLQLVASDIVGYTGRSITFGIEVGVHLLAFENSSLAVNATNEVPMSFDGLSLKLDGVEVNASSLISVTADGLVPWLSFDNSTYTLNGTPPANSSFSNVTVTAIDIYGDAATASVVINIGTSIFSSHIGNQNATAGKGFSYDISNSLRSKSDVEMTAHFDPPVTWLSLDSQSFVLSAQIPSILTLSSINVTLSAVSRSTKESAMQSFEILLVSEPNTNPTRTSLSSPTSVASLVGTSKPKKVSRSNLSRGAIAAIVIPLFFMILAILACLLCFRRRRRQDEKNSKAPLKSQISRPIEGSLRMDSKRNERIIPKDPLQLDTSDFGDQSRTDMLGNEKTRRTQRKSDLRRSQTTSVLTGAVPSQFTSSHSTSNVTRAVSDNAISSTDRSWRSTQDSAYPTIGSDRSSSQRVSRNYSNYSRKGHPRRSGQLLQTDSLRETVDYSNPSWKGPSPGVRASDLSIMPNEILSVVPERDRTLQPADGSNTNRQPLVNKKSSRQKSSLFGAERGSSGLGHGGRESISPVLGLNGKRRSIGHGQNRTSSLSGFGLPSESGMPRESKTWITMNENEGSSNDRSTGSDLSSMTDILYGKEAGQSSKNAATRQGSSVTSTVSRPVSRRIGSSPFFGGSTRNSQKRPRNPRTSYADSPTVPEEMISRTQNATVHSHDEDQRSRDSLGISYGSPREGNRQLKSFIQSQLTRSKTKSSMRSMESMESRGSRFDSASVSTYSQGTLDKGGLSSAISGEGNENAEFLPEDLSEGSWETQQSFHNNTGDLMEHGLHIPGLRLPGRRSSFAGTTTGTEMSRSNPNSPLPDIGPNARIVPGKGRRPISVDAQTGQGSVRVRLEQDDADWRVYV